MRLHGKIVAMNASELPDGCGDSRRVILISRIE
jgi:hypothetical protein